MKKNKYLNKIFTFMNEERVFYKEGFIKLNDGNTYDFKTIDYPFENGLYITIIDMYDNKIRIKENLVKFIFYYANNKKNKGVK